MTGGTISYQTRPKRTGEAAAQANGRRRRTPPMLATVSTAGTLQARERQVASWYVEPSWAVEGLFEVEAFAGSVWDPACGRGTIPTVCRARGLGPVLASDMHDRGHGTPGRDFLRWEPLGNEGPPVVDNVICNPPFELAGDFLRMALNVARHKVALLLRWSWAESVGRRWIWETTPLAAIHPFAARVSMPPGDVAVEAKGGAVCFAWWVWSHGHARIGDRYAPPIVTRIERGPK